KWLVVLPLLFSFVASQPASQFPSVDPNHYGADGNSCYERAGVPQRCVPDFINAAYNLEVQVTNTCGVNNRTKFCVQSGHSGLRSVCDVCDSRHPSFAHPAHFLTDFNNANNETWWQSETMQEDLQYPNSVNLTLILGKTFDITYVRLKFISPRPESFAIYKRTSPDSEWEPWQFYSGSCRATYGLQDKSPILPGNEAVAQCTKEFSDISPITGGNIAFSTLEGRPSAHAFEDSEVLQQFVTASAIRVVFNRMNTFGDEVFGDPQVRQSYYYAVSDFAVGGRCKCNGHASNCVQSTGNGINRLVCQCEHNTQGADCNECKPNFNDRPWKPATSMEANECMACNCSGLSNRCFFDKDLYEKTGSGGHCIDCQGNTQGVHCEECVPNHYRRGDANYCVPCGCNEQGSLNTQCNDEGQCQCKPGVGGKHCDQCLPGFYDFGPNGCKDCKCHVQGSFNNDPMCDPQTGVCTCKTNVEGRDCGKCKPGYFDLSANNQYGCAPCFCFGHSSVCATADGYYASNISSIFDHDKQKWTAMTDGRPADTTWAELDKALAISDQKGGMTYFLAPEQYLGDQRSSYNQDIIFTLRVNSEGARPTTRDIIIVGGDGKELSLPIFAQEQNAPSNLHPMTYKFRLHADPEYNWTPRLYELDFIGILSNITAIKIRATYAPTDIGFLTSFHMGSAALTASSEDPRAAPWVEHCQCMEGFVGQFCESCAPGYRREVRFGGSFNRCIKCDCHGHSDSCDAESGACICEHHTTGDTCERCERGFYGNALSGTSDDCQACPCPEGGPCSVHSDGDIFCTDCPTGYTGRRCDECMDDYFGNPAEKIPCKKCDCNGNVDINAIGNCDQITGECRKCTLNTIGAHCERCKPGYWGDALKEPKGDCRACACYVAGTLRPSHDYDVLECNLEDGQCECLPNVIGLQCDTCKPGYFNITSGAGCESCGCDPLGSTDSSCDLQTGQCTCKPGVVGRKCDQCAPYHFGFSAEGCRPCECEPIGAESPQCDVATGQCLCRDHIQGRRCDECVENRFDLRGGCKPCDDCYTLIQSRVNTFRESIGNLNNTLNEIIENPAPVDDAEFKSKVENVGEEVSKLVKEVEKTLAADEAAIVGKVAQLKKDVKDAIKNVKEVDSLVDTTKKSAADATNSLQRWKIVHKQAKEELERALSYLETEGNAQLAAAEKASKQYGEQNEQMSKLAEKARAEAEKQEKKAAEIEKMANEAHGQARQAHNEAKEAIFGGQNISRQIAEMKQKEEELKLSLERTKELALEQKKAAEAANQAAAEALTTVEGLKLPKIDPTKLKEESERLIKEAKEVREAVENEAANNRGIEEEAARLREAARSSLQGATDQQNVADNMMADVDAARVRAEDAVNSVEETLKDAKNTFNTLNEFDERTQKNKAEALKELENLPKIEETIKKADETTNEAKQAIGNAREDADRSKDLAVRAEEEAKKVAEEAKKLREAAGKSKTSAEGLKKDATDLESELEKLNSTLETYKKQTEEDRVLATESVRKASLAEKAAKEAMNSTSTEVEKVKAIIAKLNAVEDVSNSELDELEKMCEDAEAWLGIPEREAELSSMRDEKSKMEGAIHDIKRELLELKRELDTMDFISSNLPSQCFNPIQLEQEGQKKRRR
ncbi:hypothetical protein PFISCL1PPCAC_2224, partial [Pristionchus fissidentatus]